MAHVFSSYWFATSVWPCLSPYGIQPFLAPMTVSLHDAKTTLSNEAFKHPMIVEFVSFSMSMSLCPAGCHQCYVSPSVCDALLCLNVLLKSSFMDLALFCTPGAWPVGHVSLHRLMGKWEANCPACVTFPLTSPLMCLKRSRRLRCATRFPKISCRRLLVLVRVIHEEGLHEKVDWKNDYLTIFSDNFEWTLCRTSVIIASSEADPHVATDAVRRVSNIALASILCKLQFYRESFGISLRLHTIIWSHNTRRPSRQWPLGNQRGQRCVVHFPLHGAVFGEYSGSVSPYRSTVRPA
jgi:hypothetical protein